MHRRTFCKATLAAALASTAVSRQAWATVYAGLRTVDRDINAYTLAGTEQVLPRAAVQDLADSLRGDLLLPGNAAYDLSRQVLNPEVDRFPALVVRPTGVADISRAVRFADANNLVIAVKCGGHSPSGKSTCDGGLQIDLSSYRDVRVDRNRRSAYVTGGSLLGQIDHESMAQGLVTTAGTVSHTGVGGLATGGGFGRVGRRFGLTLDNIKSVDVVAGDGQLYHASVEQNPDLLWAVQGGGGNFGVVSGFEFQLHPMQRQVIGGALVFPFERARDLLETYAEYSPACPDELYSDFNLIHLPGGQGSFAQVSLCWSGQTKDFEAAIKPYRKLGKTLRDTTRGIDYVALQRSGDSDDPRAMASYLKGGFVESISQTLVDKILQGLEPDPGRLTQMYFQHSGGAIGRVAGDATAFPYRQASHNMLPMVLWTAGTPRDQHVSFIKRYWESLEPHTLGVYSVEVDDDIDPAQRIFAGNYARLRQAKSQYDPRNLFRLNANIQPAA